MLQAATSQYNLANKVEIVNFVLCAFCSVKYYAINHYKSLGRLKTGEISKKNFIFVAFLGVLQILQPFLGTTEVSAVRSQSTYVC